MNPAHFQATLIECAKTNSNHGMHSSLRFPCNYTMIRHPVLLHPLQTLSVGPEKKPRTSCCALHVVQIEPSFIYVPSDQPKKAERKLTVHGIPDRDRTEPESLPKRKNGQTAKHSLRSPAYCGVLSLFRPRVLGKRQINGGGQTRLAGSLTAYTVPPGITATCRKGL